MRRAALACVTCVLLVGRAAAIDIYVDNVIGADVFSGRIVAGDGVHDGPVRSIGRALELVTHGDRVVIANTGEPYRESISLARGRQSGNDFRPLVIDGNGAVLDGSVPIPPEFWESYEGSIFRCRPRRLHYQQLFRDGRPLVRVAAPALGLPTLGPLEWCLWEGYLYVRLEPGKLIDDYAFSCAYLPVGITLYHAHDVIVANLTVQGYHLDGVNAQGGVRNCLLSGLVCRGNGRSGVAVCGSSRVGLEDCLLGDNGAAQLYSEAIAEVYVRASQLLDRTAPAVLRRGGTIYIDGSVAPTGN